MKRLRETDALMELLRDTKMRILYRKYLDQKAIVLIAQLNLLEAIEGYKTVKNLSLRKARAQEIFAEFKITPLIETANKELREMDGVEPGMRRGSEDDGFNSETHPRQVTIVQLEMKANLNWRAVEGEVVPADLFAGIEEVVLNSLAKASLTKFLQSETLTRHRHH